MAVESNLIPEEEASRPDPNSNLIPENPEGSTLGAFARTLGRVPENLVASGIAAFQGVEGPSINNYGMGKKVVDWVDKRNKALAEEYEGTGDFIPGLITKKDVAQLGPNLAFSGVSMAGTILGGMAGAVTSPVTGPVGPIAGQLAGGALAAHRMQSYQQMNDWLNKKNEEHIQQYGRPLDPAAENKFKQDFHDLAIESGLYEAGPEAVGNVLEKALMTAKKVVPGAKFVPDTILKKVMSGVVRGAGIVGTELATETPTQIGQTNVGARAQSMDEALAVGETPQAMRSWTSPEDWATSLKEVLPQVLLLSGFMGAGGAVYRQMQKKQLESAVSSDPIANQIKALESELNPDAAAPPAAGAQPLPLGPRQPLPAEQAELNISAGEPLPAFTPLARASSEQLLAHAQERLTELDSRPAAATNIRAGEALPVNSLSRVEEAERDYLRRFAADPVALGRMYKLAKSPAEQEAVIADAERRKDPEKRQMIRDMSPEEMIKELQTDHLTGLSNKRHYEEKERLPVQASADMDGLKYVNDTFGHTAGNNFLKAMGDALKASGLPDVYHFHGDEFTAEGNTAEEVNAAMEKARTYLSEHPLTFKDKDGKEHSVTASFSHGVGATMEEADKAMMEDKKARRAAGKSFERGVAPPAVGVVDVPVKSWEEQAKDAGVTFNGLQEVPGKPSVPMFTMSMEEGQGTTFMLEAGETLPQAIERKKAQAKASQAPAPKIPSDGNVPVIDNVVPFPAKPAKPAAKPIEGKAGADLVRETANEKIKMAKFLADPVHTLGSSFTLPETAGAHKGTWVVGEDGLWRQKKPNGANTGRSFNPNTIQKGKGDYEKILHENLAHIHSSMKDFVPEAGGVPVKAKPEPKSPKAPVEPKPPKKRGGFPFKDPNNPMNPVAQIIKDAGGLNIGTYAGVNKLGTGVRGHFGRNPLWSKNQKKIKGVKSPSEHTNDYIFLIDNYHGLLVDKGGREDLDVVAGEHGYESDDALFNALLDPRKKDEGRKIVNEDGEVVVSEEEQENDRKAAAKKLRQDEKDAEAVFIENEKESRNETLKERVAILASEDISDEKVFEILHSEGFSDEEIKQELIKAVENNPDFEDFTPERIEQEVDQVIQDLQPIIVTRGWYILSVPDMDVGSGPYETLKEARLDAKGKRWYNPDEWSIAYGGQDDNDNFHPENEPGEIEVIDPEVLDNEEDIFKKNERNEFEKSASDMLNAIDAGIAAKNAKKVSDQEVVEIRKAVDEGKDLPDVFQTGEIVLIGEMAKGKILKIEGSYALVNIEGTPTKAYQRVHLSNLRHIPDGNVAFAKAVEVVLDDLHGAKKGEVKADKKRLIPLLGAQMYEKNISDITVKELMQNAFDTVKEAVYKKVTKLGHITIEYNSDERWISVTDDGMGMNRSVVENAFFTIAGTEKDMPAELRSGGLGLAKMAFLYGSAKVRLDTYKNGVHTWTEATNQQIIDETYVVDDERAAKTKHGTTIKIWIPEAREDHPVAFPYGASSPDIMSKPLIGPVEIKTIFNGIETVQNLGVNWKTDKYDIRHATFDWGTADIYFGIKRKEHSWGTHHLVLSSGVYQFATQFDVRQYEKIPFDIVIDMKPNVPSEHPDYPFNNSREGFKKRISADIEGLSAYLSAIARGEENRSLQENFSNVKTLPRIDEVGQPKWAREGVSVDAAAEMLLADAKAREAREQFEKERAALPPASTLPKAVKINKDGVSAPKPKEPVADAKPPKPPKPLEEQTEAEKKKAVDEALDRLDETKDKSLINIITKKDIENRKDPSFKPDRPAPEVDDFTKNPDYDPKRPIYHNNIASAVNLLDVGESAGGEPQMMFSELGSLMVEMKEAIAESKLWAYEKLPEFFAGISIDKTYAGVHIRVPYKAIYINPFQFVGRPPTTPFGIAGLLYETALHEIAHAGNMGHGEGHNQEMLAIRSYLLDSGLAQTFQDAWLNTILKHEKAYNAMRGEYDKSTTRNISIGLKQYEGQELRPVATDERSPIQIAYSQGPVSSGEERAGSGDLFSDTGRGREADVAGSNGEVPGGLPPGVPPTPEGLTGSSSNDRLLNMGIKIYTHPADEEKRIVYYDDGKKTPVVIAKSDVPALMAELRTQQYASDFAKKDAVGQRAQADESLKRFQNKPVSKEDVYYQAVHRARVMKAIFGGRAFHPVPEVLVQSVETKNWFSMMQVYADLLEKAGKVVVDRSIARGEIKSGEIEIPGEGKITEKASWGLTPFGQAGPGLKTPGPKQGLLFSRGPRIDFFSQLVKSVTENVKTMPAVAQSVVKWLGTQGVKPAEIKFMDIEGWLEQNQKDGRIDRQALADYVKKADLDIQVIPLRPVETPKDLEKRLIDARAKLEAFTNEMEAKYKEGSWIETTKRMTQTELDQIQVLQRARQVAASAVTVYGMKRQAQYAGRELNLEGGRDYVEMLFTWRNAPVDFTGNHFDDTKNIVGWFRATSFTNAQGQRVLHIEEIQSDWAEAGFTGNVTVELIKLDEQIQALRDRIYDLRNNSLYRRSGSEEQEELDALEEARAQMTPAPPFSADYQEFLLRRAFRYAAENGFDQITWTTGQQQIDRYDLRRWLSEIAFTLSAKDNLYRVKVLGLDGKPLTGRVEQNLNGYFTPQEIEDRFGKNIRKKIEGKTEGKLTGLALQVGGRGMEVFYDEKVTGFAKRFLRQWPGARVEKAEIRGDGGVVVMLGDRYLKESGTGVFGETEYEFTDNADEATTFATVDEASGAYNAPGLSGILDRLSIQPSPLSKRHTVWSARITPEMRESLLEPQPMWSRMAGQSAPGMSQSGVQLMVEDMMTDLAAYPSDHVHVVQRIEDLPKKEQDWVLSSNSPESVEAFTTPENHIYFIADNIRDAERIVVSTMHETIGHVGMRKAFPQQAKLDEFYRNVFDFYGKEEIDRVVLKENGYKFDLETTEGKLDAAAEMIALGDLSRRSPTLWQQFVRLIRDLVRAFGRKYGVSVNFTEDDIRDAIEASWKSMTVPEGAAVRSVSRQAKPMASIFSSFSIKDQAGINRAYNRLLNPRLTETMQGEHQAVMKVVAEANREAFSTWRQWLSRPFWNAQERKGGKLTTAANLWQRWWQIFGEERPQHKGEVTHQFLSGIQGFMDIKDAGSRQRIEKILIHLDRNKGELGSSGVTEAEQEEIWRLNYVPAAVLQRGINVGTETVRLTRAEADALIGVRKTLDSMFDNYFQYLEDMALEGYMNSPWYNLLSMKYGELSETDILHLGRNELKIVGKMAQKNFRVKAQTVLKNLEKGVLGMTSRQVNALVANYAKTYEKMEGAILEIQDILRDGYGLEGKDLKKATQELVTSYLRTRPHMQRIVEARKELEKNAFYFPRIFPEGEFEVKILETVESEGPNGEPIEKEIELFRRPFKEGHGPTKGKEAAAIIAQIYTDPRYSLNGKLIPGLRIATTKRRAVAEWAFQDVSDVNTYTIISQSIDRMKEGSEDPDALEKLYEPMYQAVADEMNSRGWIHMIKRGKKGESLEGYETSNLDKVLVDYITGYAGKITKQTAAKKYLRLMQDVKGDERTKYDLRLYESLAKAGRDNLRNQTKWDNAVQWYRSGMFTWFLGGILRPAIVNSTQNFIAAIPDYGSWARIAKTRLDAAGIKVNPHRDYFKAMNDIRKGMGIKTFVKGQRSIADIDWKKTGLSDAEQRFLQDLLITGVGKAQFVENIIDTTKDKLPLLARQIMEVTGRPFQMMEVFNRLSAGLAMFRPQLALRQHEGLSQKDAERQARESAIQFVNRTHYPMHKANYSPLESGGDIASAAVRGALTFRSFTHNYALWLVDMFGRRDFKAIATSMAWMALFGGLLGLPFIKDIFEMIEKMTGYNPTLGLKTALNKMGGKTMEKVGTAGIPGLAGLNISGSLRIGLPFTGETPLQTLTGAGGGLVQSEGRALKALTRGDYWAAAGYGSPQAVSAVFAALRGSELGKELGMAGHMTTPTGRAVLDTNGKPLSLDPWEASIRAMGFQPQRAAQERDVQGSIKRTEIYFTGKQTKIGETYRIAKEEGRRSAMPNLIKDVKAFNAERKEKGVTELVLPLTLKKVIEASRTRLSAKQRREARYAS